MRLPSWWRRLTLMEWRLLAVLAVAQIVVAAALRTTPLPALRAGASRVRRLARIMVRGSDERIVWAIEATGRRLGGLSSCLVRALVAEVVLDSSRGPASLTIGVRRRGGLLEAHAWLTRQDRVLIGATPDEFIPIVHFTTLGTRQVISGDVGSAGN